MRHACPHVPTRAFFPRVIARADTHVSPWQSHNDIINERNRIMTLSNKAYDILKWIAMILLPALGTLYFALAKIWGFPYCEEIVGTVSAVDTFLGVLLGLSSASYNKDDIGKRYK